MEGFILLRKDKFGLSFKLKSLPFMVGILIF
jgi:hypothetical protein